MKLTNKKIFFFKSIAAGWCIGLGGLINLSLPNKYIGSLAFSIGIYMVMLFNLKLITGFVPNSSMNRRLKNQFLNGNYFLCLLGNILGAAFSGVLSWYRYDITSAAATIMESKTNLFGALAGGIGCGIIIGLIVLNPNKILKWILAAPLISIFILTKMEHCVANIFYMVAGKVVSPVILIYLIFVILGNLIGGTLIGAIAGMKEEDQ